MCRASLSFGGGHESLRSRPWRWQQTWLSGGAAHLSQGRPSPACSLRGGAGGREDGQTSADRAVPPAMGARGATPGAAHGVPFRRSPPTTCALRGGGLGPLSFGPGAAGALPPCPRKKAAAGPRRRAVPVAVPRTGAAPLAARRGRRCGGRPAVPPGPRRGQGCPAAAAEPPPRAGPGSAPASLRAASAGEPGLCPGEPGLGPAER